MACFGLFHSANVSVYSDGKDGYVFTLSDDETKLTMKFKITPPEGRLGRLWSRFNNTEGQSTQWKTANFAHKLVGRMGGSSVLFITMYKNPDFSTGFKVLQSRAMVTIDGDSALNARIKIVAGLFEREDTSYDKDACQYKLKLHDPEINVKLKFPQK